jgi:hypothetical protein
LLAGPACIAGSPSASRDEVIESFIARATAKNPRNTEADVLVLRDGSHGVARRRPDVDAASEPRVRSNVHLCVHERRVSRRARVGDLLSLPCQWEAALAEVQKCAGGVVGDGAVMRCDHARRSPGKVVCGGVAALPSSLADMDTELIGHSMPGRQAAWPCRQAAKRKCRRHFR